MVSGKWASAGAWGIDEPPTPNNPRQPSACERVLLTRQQPNSLDHMLPVMLERAAAVGELPDSWRADAQRAVGKVSGSPSVEGSLVGAQPHSWVGKVGRGECGAGEEGQQQASAHLCLGGRPHTFSCCVQATSARIQKSLFGTHPQLMCSILYPSD